MPAPGKLPRPAPPPEPMESTEPPLARITRMVRAWEAAVQTVYGVRVFRRVTPGSPTYAALSRGLAVLTERRIAPEPWARHVVAEFRAMAENSDSAPLELRARCLAFSAAPPPLNVVFAPGTITKKLDGYKTQVKQYITEPVKFSHEELETVLRDTERKLRAERPGVNVLGMAGLWPIWYRELRAVEIAGVACVA